MKVMDYRLFIDDEIVLKLLLIYIFEKPRNWIEKIP